MNIEYINNIRRLMQFIEETEADIIDKVSEICADAIYRDRLLYFFGTGHSHMICEEPFYRAGGLASIYPVLEPIFMLHEGASKSSIYERIEGNAAVAIEQSGIGEGDVLFIVSNSGRNCAPIDAAIEGRRLGATTIAMTSLEHSQSVSSRHSSGKLLYEVCDYCLDNGGEPGDASISLDGLEQKIGPTSSIIDLLITNTLIIGTVEILIQMGVKPPVFISANVDDGELNNDSIIKKFQTRIKIL
ncbi:MAG TPA: hypothetical protein DIW17_03505 [Clostridiales bacterium]|nr:hypothetical protein [Clostridiales bacterium]